MDEEPAGCAAPAQSYEASKRKLYLFKGANVSVAGTTLALADSAPVHRADPARFARHADGRLDHRGTEAKSLHEFRQASVCYAAT